MSRLFSRASSMRLSNVSGSLLRHIDADAAEIGQTTVVGTIFSGDRGNSFDIFRRDLLIVVTAGVGVGS